MEIKDMKLFLSIVQAENLTRAAKKNGYTQSAASHILKRLETELGFPLFSRSQKGLVLTRSGESLIPHIRRILSAVEYFDREVNLIRGIQKSCITVGAYPSVSAQWLPAALLKFRAEHPNIVVDIREGTFHNIQNWLEDGSIDFGICDSSEEKQMDWFPLKKESYMAVCSLDCPHSKCDCFDLVNLDTVPYIAGKNEDYLLRRFRDIGVCPQPHYFSLSTDSMIAMVKHNLGVCILPELTLCGTMPGIAILPLNPPIERTLGICLPKLNNAPAAVRQFISQLQKTVFEIEGLVF